MKPVLRIWHVLLLAGAVLLAPQLALVHALSHFAHPGTRAGDERHQASDKVCETCLAIAQAGPALLSQHQWRAQAERLPRPIALAFQTVALASTQAFLARGPPAALI